MKAFDLRVSIGWALYDFANTIFSAVMLTAYFPLYLTQITGANWPFGTASAVSMILAGLALPFLGALTDRTGKTKTYLVRTTLTAILFLFPLMLGRSPWLLIGCFLISCFFYHASLVFYNSLLPAAAPPEKQGLLSGIGTGLGYLGVIFALPIAHLVDERVGRVFVFPAAGLLFLVFSIPLFLFVPERKTENPERFRWRLGLAAWRELGSILRKLPKQTALLLFLGGNFFVVDAVNALIFWFMVFAREMFHPPQSQLILLLAAANASSFLFGIAAGFLTDRFGAMKIMIAASLALILSLAWLVFAPGFSTLVGVSLTGAAFAISGIWTAGRKILIELAPPEELGGYFGLYGLTTKISVLGTFFFSIVSDLAGFRQALGLLLFPACAGALALYCSSLVRKPA